MKVGDRFRACKWFFLICVLSSVVGCDPKDRAPAEASQQVDSSTESAAGPKSPQSGKHSSDTKKAKDIKRRKGSSVQAISFDDITFKMEKDDPFVRSMLTNKITDYEGKPIKIRGFILPSFKQDGLTQFVLVRDNMECCFGPGAALYDCVMVQMQPGKSTSFSVRPVTVEGDFKIEEWKDFDGVIRAIYHLDGKSVY